jgi:nucleotide-binding universal stress UspA family protein
MSGGQFVDTTSAAEARHRGIVVGLDGSPAAAAALQWAAKQSQLTGLRLHVVHAWQVSALGTAAAAAGAPPLLSAAIEDARARATHWAREALRDDTQVHWYLDIVEGSPGPVLVVRSRDARLLVIGTQEHTGLHRAVPGSVSHYCLSHAHAPVVAVPAPSEAADLVSSRETSSRESARFSDASSQ